MSFWSTNNDIGNSNSKSYNRIMKQLEFMITT